MLCLGLQGFRLGRQVVGDVPLSAEVTQFLARVAPEPDEGLRGDYVALIDGLVADGVWSKLEWLLLLAVDHEGQAATNLVGAGQGNPEPSLGGTWTWTANRGYQSSNLARYNAGFRPDTASVFQRNNGFVGVYDLTTTQSNVQIVNTGPADSSTTGDQIVIWPWYSNNLAYAHIAVGAASQMSGAFTGPSNGWYVVERTASNASKLTRNGTQLATSAAASVAYTANHFVKLPCRHQTAAFAAGASLTVGEHTALRTRISTFLTARGAI